MLFLLPVRTSSPTTHARVIELGRCLAAFHDVVEVPVDIVVFGCQHQFVAGEFFHNEDSGVATVLNLQQLLAILLRESVFMPLC